MYFELDASSVFEKSWDKVKENPIKDDLFWGNGFTAPSNTHWIYFNQRKLFIFRLKMADFKELIIFKI